MPGLKTMTVVRLAQVWLPFIPVAMLDVCVDFIQCVFSFGGTLDVLAEVPSNYQLTSIGQLAANTAV